MKLTVPEVMPLLTEFAQAPGNSVGGVLHIVLDGRNVSDRDVLWCREQATEEGDALSLRMCDALLQLSRTQRAKLADRFYAAQRGRS